MLGSNQHFGAGLESLGLAGARAFEHGGANRPKPQAHLHLSGNGGEGVVIGRGSPDDGIDFGCVTTGACQGAPGSNHRHIYQRLVFSIWPVDEARRVRARHPAAQFHGTGAHMARAQPGNTFQVIGAARIT